MPEDKHIPNRRCMADGNARCSCFMLANTCIAQTEVFFQDKHRRWRQRLWPGGEGERVNDGYNRPGTFTARSFHSQHQSHLYVHIVFSIIFLLLSICVQGLTSALTLRHRQTEGYIYIYISISITNNWFHRDSKNLFPFFHLLTLTTIHLPTLGTTDRVQSPRLFPGSHLAWDWLGGHTSNMLGLGACLGVNRNVGVEYCAR